MALPVVVIVDVLNGYLSVYFGIYWQLLRTILLGNLATNSQVDSRGSLNDLLPVLPDLTRLPRRESTVKQ